MEEEEGVALGEEQEAGEYFPRCHFRPMGGEVRDGGGGAYQFRGRGGHPNEVPGDWRTVINI